MHMDSSSIRPPKPPVLNCNANYLQHFSTFVSTTGRPLKRNSKFILCYCKEDRNPVFTCISENHAYILVLPPSPTTDSSVVLQWTDSIYTCTIKTWYILRYTLIFVCSMHSF